MPSPRRAICCSTSAPVAWTSASNWRRRSWPGSAPRCPRRMRCKASSTSTTATCWASSTGRRTPRTRPRSTPRSSAPRTPRSPAAATSSCRNTCTIWRRGMRCPPKRRNASSAAPNSSDIELDDAVKPTSAHNALTVIEENGKEIKIVRANMPFGQAGQGEFGTYFIGYARSPRTIEQMLTNMFVGRPPGNYDRLLDFSRAVTGNLFFVPSRTFLDGVTADPPATGATVEPQAPIEDRTGRYPAVDPVRAARLARHRLAERRPPGMNNLHRELAPISEAAWAQIEEEASRTLKRYLAARRVVDVRDARRHRACRRRHRPPARCCAARRWHHRPAARGKAAVELRVPFELERWAIDDVERGSNDSDWQPLKDAAERIAVAEDRAIFDGYAAADIQGIRQGTSNPVITLPADVARLPWRHRQGAEPIASGRRQRSLFGAAGRRCLQRAERGRRPRIPGAGAYQAAGERGDHLGSGYHRRGCPDHARRRLRPAHRPGHLHRLSPPIPIPSFACICRRRSRSSC